jgi:hypothetical protein
MCFIVSFVPATIFLTIGYFVLFSSKKTEGSISKFGLILAIWLFIVAGLYPICGAYLTISGKCPIEKIIEKMQTPDDD